MLHVKHIFLGSKLLEEPTASGSLTLILSATNKVCGSDASRLAHLG
ncbi:MAG: hypothetical protein IJR50_00145 [Treponema sp.]|nr:hypothetical protein [Treponema sp.]